MRRLQLFVKGNVDVRDSLFHSSVGGTVQWNGINEIVRQQFPGHVVRVQHETCSRSDALAAARGHIPPELCEIDLPLGPYTLAAQFSSKVFDAPSTAVVLSIQPDVTAPLLRQRRTGSLLFPYGWEGWPREARQWAEENFDYVDFLDPAESMASLAQTCARIRAARDVPILIYNLSAVVPGEQVHCHAGLDEALSTRVRRFNVALIELSRQHGISIVDVDALLARAGADRLKAGLAQLTAEGYRLVAQEVVRILCDLGCFD